MTDVSITIFVQKWQDVVSVRNYIVKMKTCSYVVTQVVGEWYVINVKLNVQIVAGCCVKNITQHVQTVLV